VDDLAFGGRGVARSDGFVVFASDTTPGDRARVRVRKARRRFAEADLLLRTLALDPSRRPTSPREFAEEFALGMPRTRVR